MERWLDMMTDMLRYMAEKNASDLHLSTGVSPYVRVHGKIKSTEFPPLSQAECEELIFSILPEAARREYGETRTLDYSYGKPELGCFRINIYQQRGSIAAALRRLPIEIPSIEELGLPVEPVKNFCNLSRGLVLICGPTGNGKTTTMASMINYINKSKCCHIISIEDPIEYVHKNINSLVHQREVRHDTPNFTDALKYILREDPDVVVIGEMRDLETIASALTIAETGHLVLATLHTGDTSESVRRIIDVFPVGQQAQAIAQLAYTLAGVVNQVLIPKNDNYSRVLATEVLLVTPAIQNIIREGKTEQIYSHIQMGTNFGMHTMNQSLYNLARGGTITREMALAKSTKQKELLKLFEK
ncbi:MAG: type IV pilus twitching motility protein PilT [Endomicrobiales bacterium]